MLFSFQYRGIFYFVFIALIFWFVFFPGKTALYVLGVYAAVAGFIAFFYAHKIIKTISLVLLLAGVSILGSAGVGVEVYLKALVSMLNIYLLFIVIQFLAFPLQLGGYTEAIFHLFIRYVTDKSRSLLVCMSISYLVTTFSIYACIPIVHSILSDTLNKLYRYPKRFLSLTLLRGYAAALMWSPLFPFLGLSLQLTGSRWMEVAPITFFMGLVFIIITFFKEKNSEIAERKSSREIEEEIKKYSSMPSRLMVKKFTELFVVLMLLIFLLVLLETYIARGFIDLMLVLTLVISFSWAFYLKQLKCFLKSVKSCFEKTIPGFNDQLLIFIAAGFMATSLQVAPLGEDLSLAIYQFTSMVGTGSIYFLIPAAILLLSCLGVHPLATLAVLGASLDPDLLGVRPHHLAVIFTIGSTVTYITSPFTATNLMLSGLIKEPPYVIGLKWQGVFTVAYLLLTGIIFSIIF